MGIENSGGDGEAYTGGYELEVYRGVPSDGLPAVDQLAVPGAETANTELSDYLTGFQRAVDAMNQAFGPGDLSRMYDHHETGSSFISEAGYFGKGAIPPYLAKIESRADYTDETMPEEWREGRVRQFLDGIVDRPAPGRRASLTEAMEHYLADHPLHQRMQAPTPEQPAEPQVDVTPEEQ